MTRSFWRAADCSKLVGMLRTILGRSLVPLVLFLGAGCESALKPNGKAEFTLEADKKSSEGTARVANRVRVTLPPVPVGFVWQISYHDARFLKQMEELKMPGKPDEGGTVTFLALNTGRTRLRFLLVPPNDGKTARPVDQQELVLTISF